MTSSRGVGAGTRTLLVLCAPLLAVLAIGNATASAAGLAAPAMAPFNTVVDGPSANIAGLDGISIARDGSGGLVYVKRVSGVAHVFVSRLLRGSFQAPVQVDVGLVGPSSQPVIAADRGGMLLVAFINGGELYVAGAANASPLSSPAALFAGASDPALSLSDFGKAYLAFTAAGAGGHDVRAAYFYRGRWSLESAPLDAVAADDAGTGTGRPQVIAAGDGVGIVVWGENGHIFSRRVWRTSPSVVYEQADVPTFDGWSEVSADDPVISGGGDSSYATVAFQERLTNGTVAQSRVLGNRLRASRYDGARAIDATTTGSAEGAQRPQASVADNGAGFVTAEQTPSNQLFATTVGPQAARGQTLRIDSLPNTGAPDAVPATAGLYSTLIAWQQSPGIAGPAEIRMRYAPGSASLGPEQVVSSPALGATDAAAGLVAGGDVAGDAAIAWVQNTGAGTQIVAAQLYRAPGPFGPEQSFRYATSADPVLSWSAASELWGPTRYEVAFDGAPITQTTATSIRTPVPVANGPHTWQVTATNRAGLSSAARAVTVFVDTVPPRVSFRITGARTVNAYVHINVKYTDSPPPLTPSTASGVLSAQVKWGDGSRFTITHGKYHSYARAGIYTVRVIVRDRAGNKTIVTSRIRIKPKAKAKASLRPKLKPKRRRHELATGAPGHATKNTRR